MPVRFFKSEAFRLGVIGALIGISAPIMHTFIQLVAFHSSSSISDYFRQQYFASSEALVSNLFIGGAAVVMGLGGALVGVLREKDGLQRYRIESSNRELAALNSVAEVIAKTRELDAILYLVLKETLSLSFLTIEKKGAIFIRDEADPGMLRMTAQIGLAPDLVKSERQIKLGHCLCGKAAQTCEIITSMNCFDDKDHTTQYPGMMKHGHIVVPLVSKQGMLGVMTFYLPPNVAPLDEDVRILSAVASQLSVAIENVWLGKSITEAREVVHQKGAELASNVEALKALVEVDRIILSTFDRDEMLFKVCSQIRQLVPADVGGICLKDPDTGEFFFTGGWGIERRKGEVLLPAGWNISPSFKAGKPIICSETRETTPQSPIDRMMTDMGMRSNIYVPITKKGEVAGLFFLGSVKPAAFPKEIVKTTATFASRMGIALEHARLIHNLEEMSVNVIHVLATAIDAKSPWTKGHSERVADYSMLIAEKMGMSGHVSERLRLAGLLHDIGKIGTYDILLDKTEKLTDEEQELIKQHPDRGCEILTPIKEFKDILPAVRHHHERWDGNGYPTGLRGEEIPPVARILCVADAFDTMTADRPYRPSIGLDNAVQELRYCSGTQFAPEVVIAFLDIVKERGPSITNTRNRQYGYNGRIFTFHPD